MTGRDPKPLSCVACHAILGDAAKELPVTVDGETWCPQCFVHHRASGEPGRWPPGTMHALRCASCGITSLAAGWQACGQCGSKRTLLLPPKGGAAPPPPPPPAFA